MNDAQPDDLAQRFTYHPPTPEQPEVYQLLRDAAYHLALLIQAASKPSREQSLALTKVEEAVMHANSAIARHGLADPAYAGATDLHDHVLDRLAEERPSSALVNLDEEHWHRVPESGSHEWDAAVAKALTDPVREPLSRLGVSVPAEDPWKDKPPYLMLELALREVLVRLRADEMLDSIESYIERVLANDLTDPEGPVTCAARHPWLKGPASTSGCDNPPDHQGPHHLWYDDGRAETTITWERG